jgi:thiamine pyrophosphokinase
VDKVDKIALLGGLGSRLDHQYVNMQLMKRYPKVQLINKNNHLMIVSSMQYILKEDFKYLSLFALEDSMLTIEGVKYPLFERALTPNDLFALSNEFAQQQAKLTITKGKVLLIKSKD